jgi:hypothetical protein
MFVLFRISLSRAHAPVDTGAFESDCFVIAGNFHGHLKFSLKTTSFRFLESKISRFQACLIAGDVLGFKSFDHVDTISGLDIEQGVHQYKVNHFYFQWVFTGSSQS